MLEIVPPGLHIDFLGKAKLGIALSIVVILTGLSTMVWRGGLKQGIDFSGGTLIQLRFSQPADLGTVREALESVGWERAIVQHYGDTHEVLIRITQRTSEGQDIGGQIQRALQERLPGQTIDIRRMEAVGAQVSTELRHQAAFALLYAMLGMTIYISGRFEAKWFIALGLAAGLFVVTSTVSSLLPGLSPVVVVVTALIALIVLSLVLELLYALAAIVAIYHDVLVTVGFLALFDKEFDLQIVAALLTIIGYSLNEALVQSDGDL
jgi:preprotein translocase subunit SecF